MFMQPSVPRRGIPDPPGLPIDNGIILLFSLAILFGAYMYYKKNIKVSKNNNIFSKFIPLLIKRKNK